MQKTVLTFGIIAGLIVSVFMLISISLMEDIIDFSSGEILGYISMIVALSSIFIGIKNYRDKELQGSIGFAKAFQIGILITLVASVIYVASWITYLNVSDSNFIDSYTEYMKEELKNSGEPQDVIEEKIVEIEDSAEMYRNPFIQIVLTFFEIFPVGLLVSLIAAFLLRKETAAGTA